MTEGEAHYSPVAYNLPFVRPSCPVLITDEVACYPLHRYSAYAVSLRYRVLRESGLAFGIAGALWGFIVFWLEGQGNEEQLSPLLSYLGILVYILPYLLGGALFGAAFGYMVTED